MIEAPAGLDGVSSSAVREKLREGLPGAEAMLHPGGLGDITGICRSV